MAHDSASPGVLTPPGIGLTSASCSAESTMNGVIAGSASPGSNQRGASVTWKPSVIVPSGAASARKARAPTARSRTSALTRALFMNTPQFFLSRTSSSGAGADDLNLPHLLVQELHALRAMEA